jgi:hypothetical protein
MWTVLSDLDSIHFSVKAHYWLKSKEEENSPIEHLTRNVVENAENMVKIHTKDETLDFRDLFT